MVRKPASMYRQIKGQAYTRREYMGGVPASRVSQYVMGNPQAEFPVTLTLKVKNRVQVRHTSIEAGRIAANKVLTAQCGSPNYNMVVRAFPTSSSGRTSSLPAQERTVCPAECARASERPSEPLPGSSATRPS